MYDQRVVRTRRHIQTTSIRTQAGAIAQVILQTVPIRTVSAVLQAVSIRAVQALFQTVPIRSVQTFL